MSVNKNYYWLQLKNDFFNQKEMKKLRSIAGGDTYTIIYLKLQLLAIKKAGKLVYEGVEDDFVKEMALEIDELVENVSVTMNFLSKHGLLESVEASPDELFMPEAANSIGKITSEGIRKKSYRERLGQCPTSVPRLSEKRPPEIEIEIEKDIEIYSAKDKNPKRSKKPSIEEISDYCRERENKVEPYKFFDYYESNGWRVGKNPMKDWRAAVRTWERQDYSKPKEEPKLTGTQMIENLKKQGVIK